MKNNYTYNFYFNDEGTNLEKIMETILDNYIKQLLNSRVKYEELVG